MRQVSEYEFAILDYFFLVKVNDCNEMDWLLLTAGCPSTRDKRMNSGLQIPCMNNLKISVSALNETLISYVHGDKISIIKSLL